MKCILMSAIVCSQLEGIPDSVSEQGMRKGLYQKVGWVGFTLIADFIFLIFAQIITAFPEGWMTSGNISRDSKSLRLILNFLHLHTMYSLGYQEKARE